MSENVQRRGRKGGGFRLTWKAAEVERDFVDAVAEGWTDFGLQVENKSKKHLYKGHGVITGTLRRSIHIAQPGYNWQSDDVTPSESTPERGSKRVEPLRRMGRLMLQIGSGLVYALIIELGGNFEGLTNVGASSFIGYRYLRGGLSDAKPDLMAILKARVARKFPDRKTLRGIDLAGARKKS